MLKIGLTGGIGSGKSSTARFFTELGVDVIDSDLIARELVKAKTPAFNEIVNHFGKDIINNDGELNRPLLREIVFKTPNEKKWLEELLHPLIYQELENRIQKVKSKYCILVVPLLLETKKQQFVDRILVIDAPVELQLQRSTTRDNLSSEQAINMISSQLNREQRLKAADDIIQNDKTLEDLKRQVNELHKKYLAISS